MNQHDGLPTARLCNNPARQAVTCRKDKDNV
jgi:hypothetical protein